MIPGGKLFHPVGGLENSFSEHFDSRTLLHYLYKNQYTIILNSFNSLTLNTSRYRSQLPAHSTSGNVGTVGLIDNRFCMA